MNQYDFNCFYFIVLDFNFRHGRIIYKLLKAIGADDVTYDIRIVNVNLYLYMLAALSCKRSQ